MTFKDLFGREPDSLYYMAANKACRQLVVVYYKPPKISPPCCIPEHDHDAFRIVICDHHRKELFA